MNRSDIDETVRDFWATRPSRRRDGRKIAGVAAALGRRYRIDPILVRVALVVATVFGGAGVFVYLLGWLTLPEDDHESSAVEAMFGHGRSSMSKALTVVLMIALIPAVSAAIGGGLSGVLAIGAAGAALFLTHKHRAALGEPGVRLAPAMADLPGATVPAMPYAMSIAGPYQPYAPPAGSTAGSMAASMAAAPTTVTAPVAPAPGANPAFDPACGHPAPSHPAPSHPAPGHPAPGHPAGGYPAPASGAPDQSTGFGPEPRQTPPAWDPLGVAPFAWDLPEPTPTSKPEDQQACAPRKRSAVTPVTLGLTLVTAGAAAMVATASDAVGAREVAAVALATVGLGLLVGSFTRGGRGLIGAAIPLAIVTFVLSIVPVGNFGADDMGSRTWTPATIADVQPIYELSTGDMTLDLSSLELEDGDRVVTAVEQGAGKLLVILPPDADAEVTCEAGMGRVECLGETSDGMQPGSDLVRDDGDDGDGGGTIVLDASLGMGDMEVRRG